MLDQAKHKNIILQILKDIYTDTSLGPKLGFKGGTAAWLFYDLPRFSVDLDFNLLDPEEKESVFVQISPIIEKYGTLKEKYNKRYTLFFNLSYEDHERNLKVEISKRNHGSAFELKNYLGVSMLVMTQPDMFANKLIAMLDRRVTASRDLFDVWYFLKKNWPINEVVIKERMDLSLTDYLQKSITFISKIPQKQLLQGLGELVDEKTKVWVKTKLKEDLLFLLKLKLEESLSRKF